MTRIVQAGWESGDAQQAGSVGATGTNVLTPAAAASAPTPRSGGYCLKCATASSRVGSNTTLNAAYSRTSVPHATLAEVWDAVGFYWTHSSEPGGSCWVMLHTLGADGNVNVMLACDAGTIRAYAATAGAANPNSANFTAIGSASAPASAGAWHLVEVRLIAATTATGTCQVYLDGVQVINATAVRTAQTAANYAVVLLGLTVFATIGTSTCVHAYDDLRINSTAGTVNNGRPGDESIRLIVPNAPGDLTQLTRGGTDTGANWDQCDEVPASTAEYVTGAGAGLTDLYHTTDLAPTSVSAVNVLALASNASGGGTVALVTKTPAGQSSGTPVSLQTTWGWTSRLLETDPSGGAAWDSAKLAALQLGVSVG